MVTWGTNPGAVVPITGAVPDPSNVADEGQRAQMQRMLEYMALKPGQKLADVPIDVVFIGSCTNGRIEDIRAAAAVAKGRHVAAGVQALVVPGSGQVKKQAEDEGLDRILLEAGFEWRDPCCSMCLGMNPDKLTPGQRCASTSNRNFEGRQGVGWPHAPGVAGDGRRRRGDRPAGRCAATGVTEAVLSPTRHAGARPRHPRLCPPRCRRGCRAFARHDNHWSASQQVTVKVAPFRIDMRRSIESSTRAAIP